MEFYTLIEVPKESDRKDIAFGVMVPCLPGCFSAGDTMEEAIENAQEAITLYIEDLLERAEPIPKSHPLDVVDAKKKPGNWIAVRVDVKEEYISTKAARVNVTIPEGVLAMIDDAAEKEHKNRSAFLTDAALEKIKKQA